LPESGRQAEAARSPTLIGRMTPDVPAGIPRMLRQRGPPRATGPAGFARRMADRPSGRSSDKIEAAQRGQRLAGPCDRAGRKNAAAGPESPTTASPERESFSPALAAIGHGPFR
jgi:hypothetical protein